MDPKPKTPQEVMEEERVKLEELAILKRSAHGKDPIKRMDEPPVDDGTPEYVPSTPQGANPNEVIEEEGLERKDKAA